VLLAGMARGESARDLSLKLEQFVLGGGQGMGDSVRSKAMRLARTEINNSYWEARRMSSELSPVVEGIKWELSATSRMGRLRLPVKTGSVWPGGGCLSAGVATA